MSPRGEDLRVLIRRIRELEALADCLATAVVPHTPLPLSSAEIEYAKKIADSNILRQVGET